MEFFGRAKEIEKLRGVRAAAAKTSQFAVITGRRRVGKTELAKRAFGDEPFVYLFVSRKTEPELVADFVAEVNAVEGLRMPAEVRSLKVFFEELFFLAGERPVTVFVDEFQEFLRVAPGFYGDLQGLWDRHHDRSHLALVACGSVNSLMTRIFQDRKEPLYGRGTAFLRVEPFDPDALLDLLRTHAPGATGGDLLALWAVTGGVAKYVATLLDAGAVGTDATIAAVFREDSPFLEEGRMLLSDEFGGESATYFTILSAIARGANSRNAIEQIVGRPVGGHLTRLERDYRLVSKRLPLFAQSGRQLRYALEDPFYAFWFRFVFKYDYAIQIRAWEKLRQIVRRDFDAFAGHALEGLFRARFAACGEWTRMGAWWDRKGENEIDIVAEDELARRAAFYEVKRDANRFDIRLLRRKAEAFLKATGAFRGYRLEFLPLSLSDL